MLTNCLNGERPWSLYACPIKILFVVLVFPTPYIHTNLTKSS